MLLIVFLFSTVFADTLSWSDAATWGGSKPVAGATGGLDQAQRRRSGQWRVSGKNDSFRWRIESENGAAEIILNDHLKFSSVSLFLVLTLSLLISPPETIIRNVTVIPMDAERHKVRQFVHLVGPDAIDDLASRPEMAYVPPAMLQEIQVKYSD